MARLPAAERRRQLLDVAVEQFGVGGYSNASVADIAAGAGVTKPVVYQHFSSKRELFLAVLDECGERMQTVIEKAAAEADSPHDKVRRGFAAFVDFFVAHPAAFRILFSDASRSDPEFAASVVRLEMMLAEGLVDLIDIEGRNPDERRILAHSLIGLAEGGMRHWVNNPAKIDADHLVDLMAEMAWRGLRGS